MPGMVGLLPSNAKVLNQFLFFFSLHSYAKRPSLLPLSLDIAFSRKFLVSSYQNCNSRSHIDGIKAWIMLTIENLKLRCGYMQGDFFLFDLLLFGGVLWSKHFITHYLNPTWVEIWRMQFFVWYLTFYIPTKVIYHVIHEPPFAISAQDKKKTTPLKGSDMKRTRRDRGELQDIMFKLFEKQPNWALKQLVEVTDQPAVSSLILNLLFGKKVERKKGEKP